MWDAVQILNREFKTPYTGPLFTGFMVENMPTTPGWFLNVQACSRPVTKNRHEGRAARLRGAIIYLSRESGSAHPYAAVIRIKFVHPAL